MLDRTSLLRLGSRRHTPSFTRATGVLCAVSLALSACSDEATSGTASGGSGSGGSPSSTTTASGGSGGSGGESIVLDCSMTPPLDTSALVFDGDDYVTMGVAPELGREVFTLQAWVRRDGAGLEANTGVGGIKIVPLIGKGRGESDGTNLDCNYAFGIAGDVLGADFEDLEGTNHPVLGKTALDLGRWYHAAATYDGTTWRLYLDGVLDGEEVADATPRADSIQHFGLGAAFNSTGVAAGAFVGALDEVRVHARALTATEIADGMFGTSPDPLDLIGHFRLDAVDGAVKDSSGLGNDGVLQGTAFVTPGAVLDRGKAPALSAPSATPAGADLKLAVDVSDLDGDDVRVEFFARELTDADDFTVVVLPDTQYYTRDANPPERPQPDDPTYFSAQTQWAVDHREDRNVIGLFGVGDIINNADQIPQWNRAEKAYEILEKYVHPDFPDGLPYGVAFGNHDEFENGMADGTVVANEYFGVDRFMGRSYYGGHFGEDNDENWVSFWAGDLQVIVVSMQFNTNPSDEVLTWARNVFLSHPKALGIVASHSILTGGGNFDDQGAAIYEAMKDVPNVQLMASGHVSVDARRTDDAGGNIIHTMLSDYQRCTPDPEDPTRPLVGEQSRRNGGRGYMRIWRFSPSKQKLFVESHSPKENGYFTDDRNKFELDVDLHGTGVRGEFISVGTAIPEGGKASVSLPGFATGKAYEWYAVARDCSHETPLALQSLIPTE